MWHFDHGTAFAAEALTGLHAGQGLQGAVPHAIPATEAEIDAAIEQFTAEVDEQEDQVAAAETQGTAPAAAPQGSPPAAVPAAAHPAAQAYKSAQELATAIHDDQLFPMNE